MEPAVDVLFVCAHGSAKSVIAAEYFRRLAEERGIVLTTASAGIEADDAVPPQVVARLGAEGIDVSDRRPRQVSRDILASARRVVSFGCDLSAIGGTMGPITRWDDVPAVSDGYAKARDAIIARLQPLLEQGAADPNPARND